MHKAVFIDKDGTLINDVPYNVDPDLISLEENIIKGLQRLQEDDFKLIIISNQAGVAYGYFEESALAAVKQRIEELLGAAGIRLDGFYYCPNHPMGVVEPYNVDCDSRKPAPGMILQAASDLEINLSESWMIGDILNDVEAGKRAGCKTVLIDNGNETEWKWNYFNQPNYTAATIDEAAEFILLDKDTSSDPAWSHCKNILCVRADNMGDLLMSSPAIRALKQSFNARITVLTSDMAAGISQLIPEIDETIIYNFPWVKLESSEQAEGFDEVIRTLRERKFDAAVVFSVYSQNPLPAAMLSYLAAIPLRLAYCRENPYNLLTNWVPDKEPYSEIKHQVRRDLDLVAAIGAYTSDESLSLEVPEESISIAFRKLEDLGVDTQKPWLIAHAGVSEEKRQYPFNLWAQACMRIIEQTGYQILFTGGASERELTDNLKYATGKHSWSLGGQLSLHEFVALIKAAPLLISVNTGSAHIAAALGTPLIVLYALSNPQHYPWLSFGKVFPFSVSKRLQSKNEIIRYVNQSWFEKHVDPVTAEELAQEAEKILAGEKNPIPELPERFTKLSPVSDRAALQPD